MRYFLTFLTLMLLSSCTTITISEHDLVKRGIISSRAKFEKLLVQLSNEDVKVSEKKISLSKNLYLVGVDVRPENAGSCNILYFGGNRSTVTNFLLGLIEYSKDLHCELFMFDRRGYGLSKGSSGVSHLLSDASKVATEVQKWTKSENLIIHGQSLGSFEAAHTAQQISPDGLVLESSAVDTKSWLDSITPWYLNFSTSIRISNELKVLDNSIVLRKIATPLLILVGENDRTTPPALSKQIYKIANSEQKTLKIISNASHEDVFSKEETIIIYKKFLASTD